MKSKFIAAFMAATLSLGTIGACVGSQVVHAEEIETAAIETVDDAGETAETETAETKTAESNEVAGDVVETFDDDNNLINAPAVTEDTAALADADAELAEASEEDLDSEDEEVEEEELKEATTKKKFEKTYVDGKLITNMETGENFKTFKHTFKFRMHTVDESGNSIGNGVYEYIVPVDVVPTWYDEKDGKQVWTLGKMIYFNDGYVPQIHGYNRKYMGKEIGLEGFHSSFMYEGHLMNTYFEYAYDFEDWDNITDLKDPHQEIAYWDENGEEHRVSFDKNATLDFEVVYVASGTTVIYHSNFGDDKTESVFYEDDYRKYKLIDGGHYQLVNLKNYDELSLPTREGYEFAGWEYVSVDGSVTYDKRNWIHGMPSPWGGESHAYAGWKKIAAETEETNNETPAEKPQETTPASEKPAQTVKPAATTQSAPAASSGTKHSEESASVNVIMPEDMPTMPSAPSDAAKSKIAAHLSADNNTVQAKKSTASVAATATTEETAKETVEETTDELSEDEMLEDTIEMKSSKHAETKAIEEEEVPAAMPETDSSNYMLWIALAIVVIALVVGSAVAYAKKKNN